MKFKLHSQLQQDCFELGHFNLCRLLLMNDQQFPWFILVPEQPGLTEIYQLSEPYRQQLLFESCYLSEILTELYQPDKMNIATLGNIVPQLHIHHIVRYRLDKAWPGPVWGKYDALPYSSQQKTDTINSLKQKLTECTFN